MVDFSLPIVEIGPGAGALTKHLLKRASHLTLIEKDRQLIESLSGLDSTGAVRILNEDFLSVAPEQLPEKFQIVSNLPYNVATPILKRLFMLFHGWQSMVIMVQKEVAQRMCATAGGRSSGFLSILMQFFSDPAIRFNVPPGAFFPPPKVQSSVLQIAKNQRVQPPFTPRQIESFLFFVSTGFSQRRKKLANSLKGQFASTDWPPLIASVVGIENARAEQLGVEQWVRLYEVACVGE